MNPQMLASPLFFIGSLVLLLLIAAALIPMWKSFFNKLAQVERGSGDYPSWVGPAITTVVIVGLTTVGLCYGWNVMHSMTSNSSNYKSTEETSYRHQALESKMPSNEQLEKNRADVKERFETRPHQKVLDDFDAKMKIEAEKIKQRSLSGDSKPSAENK